MGVFLGVRPLGKPRGRLFPQPPLRPFLADEIKPNHPQTTQQLSVPPWVQGPAPRPGPPLVHRAEGAREDSFHALVGRWPKDMPPPGGCICLSWLLRLLKNKCLPWRKCAGRSTPQVLEQELGTSNGSPPLRMCAAPLRRQSVGLLWFVTDKSGVVTFYLLI